MSWGNFVCHRADKIQIQDFNKRNETQAYYFIIADKETPSKEVNGDLVETLRSP